MRAGRTDYRLQRRAVLEDVRVGRRTRDEVCDAHPELVRAGRHLGSPADDPCPVCDGDGLALVSYVFEGSQPRSRSGRVVPRESLAQQAERYGEVTVYTVEVCPPCGWHHLRESFRLLAPDVAAR